MADEATRKAVALEYCRLMNAGDLDGVMRLFTPDVRFQDPVGTPALVGLDAVRGHLAAAIAARIEEEPGTPTAAMDGESVALPVTGTMDLPGAPGGGRVRFRLVSVLRVDGSGRIREVRIIAGRTDVTPVEA
ncbi:hypothetical protein GCM10027168_19690 [Streptomyces capparidis]